jgi:hypothetical protein
VTDTPTTLLPIGLVSHPSCLWPADGERPAGRHLCMADTGRLLCITRGNVLHAAADRLVQEGYSFDATMVIRDAHGEVPDITGSIKDALA